MEGVMLGLDRKISWGKRGLRSLGRACISLNLADLLGRTFVGMTAQFCFLESQDEL